MTALDRGSVADLLCGADATRWLVCPPEGRSEKLASPSTIGHLKDEALALAGRLPGFAERGAPVLLVFENGEPFVVAFFGCLFAGMIPVPLATPHFVQHRGSYLRGIEAVASNSGAALVLTDGPTVELLVDGVATRVVSLADVAAAPWQSAPRPTGGSDTALIQYTSGSTAAPKGAELSHESILRNVRAIGVALDATNCDVGVSWLPLFHDMGLIGSLLFTLAFRMPLVLLKPRTFAFHPLSWLRAISRYRGTLSPAPTSAYQLCTTRARESEIASLDLTSWRVGLVGSEMVKPAVLRAFEAKFSACGFSGTLAPAYGLAENALAVALGRPGAPTRIDRVDRRTMDGEDRAVPSTPESPAREIVSAGRPLLHQEARVTRDDGVVLDERCVGEIEVRGPCVMKGYRGRPESTLEVFRAGGWLRTGDRGYLADGELFVVGRQKDVIKKLGLSFEASSVEAAVRTVRGIREGRVAAFGAHGTDAVERMVVAVETALTDPESLRGLRGDATMAVVRECGVRPDAIVCVRPGSLPRTTSGKLQRYLCRNLFEAGSLTELPQVRAVVGALPRRTCN